MAALHLVGADLPPDPRAPSHWHPGLPPLQHGVDYIFARWHGLVPVRWQPGTVISVRLASAADSPPAARGSEDAVDAVDAVVAELRELTGLELRGGPPLGQPIDLRRIPEQEIHVAYLPSAWAQRVRRPPVTGPPAAARCRPRTVPGTGAAGPSSTRIWRPSRALSATGLAVLRHQLGHALGLGHAARRRVLMHQRIPVDLDRYSRADQHGLALLGGTRPVPHDPPPPPAHERTVPCC